MEDQGIKYQKVIDWIKENIENGTFRSGDKLMSENELCQCFGLSRQTIRRATGALVEEKILTRVRGSGTYIGTPVSPGRSERYMSIAVISTFYESYIFPPTLKGIEKVLSNNGYSMQVAFTDNRIGKEHDILKTILEKDNVDGIIIEPSKSSLPNPNRPYYEELIRRRIPIICFNAEYPDLNIPCVRLDDRSVARKAVQYLIAKGHQDIAGIFKSDDRQGRLRYEGYLDAIMENGLKTNQKQVFWFDTPMGMNLDAIEGYLFSRIGSCSAVACYNDEVAYQVINLAQKRGLRVPQDLAVIGIDDSYLAGVCHVPITSFPHPKAGLGKKVAQNLLNMIENPAFDGNYLFESNVIVRESV